MLEAILWDNDGVLVDSERLYFEACRTTLAVPGIELTLEKYQELSLRQGVSVFRLAAAQGMNAEQILALQKKRDILYEELLRERCEVYQGVEQVLDELSPRFRMAIVTSSQRRHFEAIHNQHNLMKYFELFLVRDDYRKSKPHPDPYLAAMARLGLPADQCVAIEDTERGLTSALAAGLRCVMVPNNFTNQCRFEGATAVLQDIRELPSCLAGL